MRSESGFRDDGNIVPHGTNPSVVAAVAGCAVHVFGLGLRVVAGSSIADVASVCEKLFRSQSRVSLAYQFCLGDTYEYTLPYSAQRKELTAIIERVLGKTYADRLRHFGSIAKRWPADRRNAELPWQYYREHKPGEPGKPDVLLAKKIIRLKIESSEIVDGVETFRLKGHGGIEYDAVRVVKP